MLLLTARERQQESLRISMPESKTEVINLPYGRNDDLKALLESVEAYGAMAPAIIAKQHYDSFLRAPNNNARKVFGVEIFCKLMQSIEDYGAFCLMWGDDEGSPLEKYLNVSARRIIKFYRECTTAECSETIRKIWGIPSANELIDRKLLKGNDKALYEEFVSKFIEEIDRTFKQLRGFFQEAEDSVKKGDYGDIINMYFNAKHGFKVMFLTETSPKIGVKDDWVSIIIGPGKLPADVSILKYGKFPIEQEFVKGLFERTKMIGDKLKCLARARLAGINDECLFTEGFHNWKSQK